MSISNYTRAAAAIVGEVIAVRLCVRGTARYARDIGRHLGPRDIQPMLCSVAVRSAALSLFPRPFNPGIGRRWRSAHGWGCTAPADNGCARALFGSVTCRLPAGAARRWSAPRPYPPGLRASDRLQAAVPFSSTPASARGAAGTRAPLSNLA